MTLNKLSEYGHGFQIKVIALLLTEKKFLDNVADILSSDYFEAAAYKWVIDFIIAYYQKYHTYPTMEVFHGQIKKLENETLKVSIIEALSEAYDATMEDMEYIQDEFMIFCKNQTLKNAMMKSIQLLSTNDFDGIRAAMNAALESGGEGDLGHDYAKDVETRYREENRKKFPFPWPIFNTITDGGLGGGDLMLVFAPPGIGKSTTVSHMAAHGIRNGKNALFYSLELSDIYVGLKIDSILSGIDVKDIKHHRAEVDSLIESLPGRLIIKRYPPRKASINTLESHIRQLRTKEGFVPDLIIIDYPDYLKVDRTRKEMKQEIDDIFVGVKGLAVDLDIPIACPSQINRAGSNDDIIEGDKVAGSFDKMMIADFNISLSRKKKDKLNGTGRFHIMKSRLGRDGMTYAAKIDIGTGYMSISDKEYVEDDAESTIKGNSGSFDKEEVKEMRAVFKKFSNGGQ
jgi:hypothetical protein